MKSRFFHTTPNYHRKPQPIRLTGLNFDKRAAYVESVCTLLAESRFGPTFSYSPFNSPTSRPADEPVSLLDLIEQEFVSLSAMEFCQNRLVGREASETRRGRDAATQRLESRRRGVSPSFPDLGRAPTLNSFPPNLGRGSP